MAQGSVLARLLIIGAAMAVGAPQPASITIDYPADKSIFPPEITPPTFLWRDPAQDSTAWRIDVTFADGSSAMHFTSKGERMIIGEIDPRAVGPTNELPKLTPQQAEAHTWIPDTTAWEAIKQHSAERPATITISGVHETQSLSRGRVTIETSKDPVGAPIFYRDVPLMPSEVEKGVIKPLAPASIPLIAWRLRNVGDPQSRLLMTGLHTCANCHSFSRDGKTLGLDMDGPQNDKGMYALVPISKQMSIRNEDMIEWSSFRGKLGGKIRVGFMSQVSPDGQYVVNMINGTDAGRSAIPSATPSAAASSTLKKDLEGNYYVSNFKDYRFLQVFFPTRGILAWYSRATGKLQPLPGADDPQYVQTNAVWSPDGKYLVFARAAARVPYPEGSKLAAFANDPNETQIQYDLYRIPFNEGKGGKAEPIAGASRNGMSNTFPKVSPDGRWIVYVQARNGLLMRPDSQLYIVPAEGGKARRMDCNTPLMNSWHSFSPNGRWLVFSSKSRSPYTKMFLTHLDKNGHDSPPILIDNTTAANRAVNIPEFVNIPPDGLMKIDTPATDFYRLSDGAWELSKKGDYPAAIAEWNKAIELSPENDRAHSNVGLLLAGLGRFEEAIPHFEKTLKANPEYPDGHSNLGVALAGTGKIDQAIAEFRKALELNPESPEGNNNLARALAGQGQFDEAIPHWKKALEAKPDSAEIHNSLAVALAKRGQVDEALGHFEKAVEINPDFAEAHFNMGDVLYYLQSKAPEALAQWRIVLRLDPNHVPVLNQTAWILATSPEASLRDGAEAVRLAEKAVELSGSRDPAIMDTLAAAYAEVGRFDDAERISNRNLALATQQNNSRLTEMLRARISLYEKKTPYRTPLSKDR